MDVLIAWITPNAMPAPITRPSMPHSEMPVTTAVRTCDIEMRVMPVNDRELDGTSATDVAARFAGVASNPRDARLGVSAAAIGLGAAGIGVGATGAGATLAGAGVGAE